MSIASSWDSGLALEIISIGDAELLTAAFNGLAAITQSDSFGNMMRVAFLVGLLAFGAKGLLQNKFDAVPLLASVVMYLVMFAPKATVLVIDGFNGQVRTVANVPIGAAAPFALVSKVGRYFAETFETAFSVFIPESSFTQAGYLDALSTILKMRDITAGTANSDAGRASDIQRSVLNYIVGCVHYDLALTDPLNPPTISIENIRKTGDIWAALQADFKNVGVLTFLPGEGLAGKTDSCEMTYAKLTYYMQTNSAWQTGAFDGWMKSLMEREVSVSTSALTRLDGALSAIGMASGSAAQYSMNAFLATLLRESDSLADASTGSVQAAITSSQAENQRNIRWTAEKTMFEKVARPVTAFIEVFLIAATPIMAFAIAAFGTQGVSTLGKFLMLHFWVTLWTPTLAIANMFTFSRVQNWLTYVQNATSAADQINPMSLTGMEYLNQKLQTEFATGSMLAASTPMLTLMLIYGTPQVASMIASKMSSTESIDPKVAAPSVMQAAPVVQQTSMFSGNQGMGWGTTGAAIASASISETQNAQRSAISSAMQQQSSSAVQSAARGYTDTSGNAFQVQWSKDTGWQTTANKQNAFTAAMNIGQSVGMSQELGVGASLKLGQTLSEMTGTGGAIKPQYMGVGGGFSQQASKMVQDALGVDKSKADKLLQGVTQQMAKTDSTSATWSKALTHGEKDGESFGVKHSKDTTSKQDFSKSVGALDQLSKTYSEIGTQSGLKNVSNTFSPNQLYWGVSQHASQQGMDVNQMVNSGWEGSYGGNTKLRDSKLDDLKSQSTFRDSLRGASSTQFDTAAKAWLMMTDGQSMAQTQLFKTVGGANFVQPDLQSGHYDPKAASVATAQIGSQVPTGDTTRAAVDSQVAKGAAATDPAFMEANQNESERRAKRTAKSAETDSTQGADTANRGQVKVAGEAGDKALAATGDAARDNMLKRQQAVSPESLGASVTAPTAGTPSVTAQTAGTTSITAQTAGTTSIGGGGSASLPPGSGFGAVVVAIAPHAVAPPKPPRAEVHSSKPVTPTPVPAATPSPAPSPGISVDYGKTPTGVAILSAGTVQQEKQAHTIATSGNAQQAAHALGAHTSPSLVLPEASKSKSMRNLLDAAFDSVANPGELPKKKPEQEH